MPLDPNLVTGISTAVGAGIGGVISYLTARRQEHIVRLEAQVARFRRKYKAACEQIAAYHTLEAEYVRELARLDGKSEPQVKITFRTRVESAGCTRPSWTARDAREQIEALQS